MDAARRLVFDPAAKGGRRMNLLFIESHADASAIHGEALRRALLASGATVSVRGAQALSGAAEDDGARVLIDLRALDELAPLRERLIARGAGVIIQHEGALAPGDAAARLLAELPRVVAPSQAVADALVERAGVDRARILVLPPGVDALAAASGSGDECAIISSGARADHALLLRALELLFDLDWSLSIIGDAGESVAADARVRVIDRADLAASEAAWRGADLFALATGWSASDASVRAALRRGLPVALCVGGGAGECVDLESGVVAAYGDVEQLSKALRRVMFDRGLRAAMASAAARRGAALPDWPTQARALLDWLGS
jgi:hypothetical protein